MRLQSDNNPGTHLIAVAAAALVLALVLLYPLPLVLGDALPFNLGDPLLNAWILGWTSERLPYALDGVWDAPVFYPNIGTLAYSEHLLGVTIFVAPVYWLTGNGILAHNVAIVLSFVIAAVSMFLLAETLTGRRDAAWVAALAFAFCPPRLGGQLARVQVMMAAWLPLVFWGLHSYGKSGRGRFLAASTGAYLLLALSNIYLACYALPALVTVAGYVLMPRRAEARRVGRELLLAGAAVAVVLVPIAAEYKAVKDRFNVIRPVTELDLYSASVDSYVSVSPTSPLSRMLVTQVTADQALFPGFVLLTCVALAFVPRKLTSRPWPFWQLIALYGTVGTLSVALSFGPRIRWSETSDVIAYGPYYWLWKYVPGFDGLRAPGRFGLVVVLALAVIAAIGAAKLMAGRSRLFRSAVIAAAAVGIFAEGYGGPLPIERFSPTVSAADRQAYEWLRTAGEGVVLELPVTGAATLVPLNAAVRPSLRYQYLALEHGHPLVNGASGYAPRFMRRRDAALAPWTEHTDMPGILAEARRVGVRYIVVHVNDYLYAPLANAVLEVIRNSGWIERELEFGSTIIFEMRSPATP